MPRSLRPLLALTSFALLGACQQGDSASGSPESCDDFAGKICGKTGDTSATCRSVKETAGLMSPAACSAAIRDIETSFGKIKEARASCTELMDKLCKDLGDETSSCELVRSKTPEFPPERCQQMLAEYDKVLADLKNREAANKPLDPAKQKEIATGAPAFGQDNAKVTLVEFSDFQCPYCSRAAKVSEALREKYAGKIQFVFRQFPLSFHQDAHLAAQASLAADAQGKFWEYHDKLFENQKKLDRASLETYAQELGLNMAQFGKALDEETYKDQVDADLALGKDVAVQGTPTLFINGKRISNPTDTSAVAEAIEKELSTN